MGRAGGVNGRKVKAIGYRWEKAIVEFLHECGWLDAKRHGNLNGRNDLGDIAGILWTWQAKDVSQLGPAKLAAFMDAVCEQASRAGTRYYGLAIKRRGAKPRDGYFVMPIWMAEELMQRVNE